MSVDKYTNKVIKDDLELSAGRLSNILNSLSTAISVGDIATREEVLLRLQYLLNKHRESTNSLVGHYVPVSLNSPPSLDHYKESLSIAKDNLDLLFAEMNGLRNLGINTFNRITTERNELNNRLGLISGKIRSLGLYGVNNFVGRFIGESFTSLNSFNVDSLGTDNVLNIDLDSGLATLPIRQKNLHTINTVEIDTVFSNGRAGNKSDSSVVFNYDNIYNLADGKPETWWEYEIVNNQEIDTEGVRLGLIFTLSDLEMVNFISISPINLGTISEVDIVSIEGSTDKNNWIDLTTYMPIAQYLSETREDVISIGRSNSIKTNNLNIYTLPTTLKYIRIKLKQSEPIHITDNDDNNLFRYAIGIRDIQIGLNEYDNTGLLVSKFNEIKAPVSTLLALAAITNFNSKLYNYSFAISFGDNNYTPMQFSLDNSLSANEILDVKSIDVNPFSVEKIGFKLRLSRNDNQFEEFIVDQYSDNTFTEEEVFTTDSSRSPIVVSTTFNPIESGITLVESPIYSVGRKFVLGEGRQSYHSGTNSLIELPFYPKNLEIDDEGVTYSNISVYVNGTEWSQVSNVDNSSVDAEEYSIYRDSDLNKSFIKFGNSGGTDAIRSSVGSNGGKALPNNAVVEAKISDELLSFYYDSEHYIALFKLPFDGNKSGVSLESQGELITENNFLIPGGVSSFQLKKFMDSESTVEISQYSFAGVEYGSVTTYSTEKVYQDGSTELTTSGDYSIDYKEGIIYSYDASPIDRITIISFSYFERNVLSPEMFSLIKRDGKFVGIKIPEDNFKSFKKTETIGAARSGSGFTLDSLSSPQFYPSVGDNYNSGDTVIYLSYGGIIPGTVELPTNLFGTGSITEVEYIDGIKEFLPGSQSNFSTQDSGKYSIDYRRGLIYLSEPISTGSTISYRSGLYQCKYDVGNYIENFNVVGSRLEFQNNQLTGLSGGKIRIIYDYNVVTDEVVDNIARYYSPVIRDLQIRYV